MNPKSGIQLKVFEIIYLKEETADILLNYMIKSLKNHKLSDKIIIFLVIIAMLTLEPWWYLKERNRKYFFNFK